MLGRFASRLSGSSDIYGGSGKGPESSINFVTCHDGFTLLDLVSYERKHNEANGHHNRDGADENYSANYGIEGPTDDASLVAMRTRQVKNFLLTLAVSRGVPMLLAGDELGRTQRGNNNPYRQDNETTFAPRSARSARGSVGSGIHVASACRVRWWAGIGWRFDGDAMKLDPCANPRRVVSNVGEETTLATPTGRHVARRTLPRPCRQPKLPNQSISNVWVGRSHVGQLDS